MLPPLLRAAFLISALGSLTGCLTTQGPSIPLLSKTGLEPQAAQSAPPPEAAKPEKAQAAATPKHFEEFDLMPAVTAGEQRFQSGDVLKVAIWGYPELDHTATVQLNGHITLPLVGEIMAAGKTAASLREDIAERLKPFSQVQTPSLRPGDTVSLDVWQHADMSRTVTVAPDGSITLPLVGRVMVEGRSMDDIRLEVEEKMRFHLRDVRVSLLPNLLNRRVLHDYRVSVLASSLQVRRAAVIGEVGLQGLVDIKGGMRLMEALAQAQVLNKTAELNSIVVIRNRDSDTPQYRQIRLVDYMEGRAPDQNIYLQHDDIVIVPKTSIAKVGDFVDLFFSRTLPVFTWWSSAWQASVAKDSADSVRLINESLRADLLSITP
ncbi:MAG: polysaccharide biosynthesis/export family protein [Pseudomonadota bacterium]